MTSQSLQAFRQVITVQWPKAAEQDSKVLLVKTARTGISEISRQQTGRAGIPPSVTVYANRPGQTNIDAVVLPGPIVALFDLRKEIAKVGLDLLRAASPVQSGRYRNSHLILLNGAQVEVLPENLRDTDEIVLVNPVPYARRIEIGKTESGRDFVLQVPNRIYERVAKRKLLPIYRNVADIQFGYLELSGAYAIKGRLSSHYVAKGGTRRKRRQATGKAIRAPAIFIRAKR